MAKLGSVASYHLANYRRYKGVGTRSGFDRPASFARAAILSDLGILRLSREHRKVRVSGNSVTTVRAHIRKGRAVRQHERHLSNAAKTMFGYYRHAKVKWANANVPPMFGMAVSGAAWGLNPVKEARKQTQAHFRLGGALTKWSKTSKPPRVQRVVQGAKQRAAGRARRGVFSSLGMKRTPYGWE